MAEPEKTTKEHIITRVIEEEMKQSFLDYAMSVIVQRALPDVKDGLKPVHRRILHAMNLMGVRHNTAHKKSARIVGDVIGKFHPHGDQAVYDTMVRMAQDFSLRYPLIDGQGNWGCFTKDTKIALTDGRDLSFEELIKEFKKGKKNFTYTYNITRQSIEIAEIEHPRLTTKDAALVKVTLDNGKTVRCTPNHRFMLRDGNYKEAQQLTPGQSLMPLYLRLSAKEDDAANQDLTGYHLVLQPNKNTWTFVHQLADEYNIQAKIYSRKNGRIRHHKDFNYYEHTGIEEALNDACSNHKVLSVTFLQEKEDVYDLTIPHTHNFALSSGVFVHNSQDGDNAAAYRYTEARMSRIAEEMLADIEKQTVNFVDNYDGAEQEPVVLPSKIPNLLVNGSTGIAVGMATNMPPHNLIEVGRALITLIDNPEADKELLEHIKGPDFPTGGEICGTQGVRLAYQTGRGKVKIRARIAHEDTEKRKRLIITEIPYMVNKSQLIEQIANCVHEKKIEGISDIRDESDRKGMRIVIELKKDANTDVTINQIYKYTRCQETFGIINLALVNGEPKVLRLKELLEEFIKHRQDVIKKRTQFDLTKAQEREHIVEGLVKALDNIDAIIALIKKAPTVQAAQEQLIVRHGLSEAQSKAILEMRLSRLAALEQEKLRKELEELKKLIQELLSILADEKKILGIIKKETEELITTYADKRRTTILEGFEEEEDIEDLIESQDVVITISTAGYAKRIPIDTYRAQRRGGKGVIGAETREDDVLEHLYIANTHNYLLIFTNKGQVHWVKVYRLPESGRYSKGTALINLVNMDKEEKVSAVIPIKEFNDGHNLVMATKKGIVKKTALTAYSRPRAGGIRAITLDEGDDVVDVKLTDGQQHLMLATAKGMAVKFHEKDARVVGRTSRGVRGVRLAPGDRVISMNTVKDTGVIATITENGYGKRTRTSDYRLISRGGKGVRNIICSERNGNVVAVKNVTDEDDLLFISEKGIVIRTHAKDISIIGRNTQGLRLMKLSEDDKVASAAKILREDNGEIHESEE